MEDLEVAPEQEQIAIEESTVDPMVELQNELDKAKDQYLRACAEAENVRKRSREEVARATKYAIENFAENLIPVADSLHAALESATDDAETLKQGLEITLKQLISAFTKSKMKEIDPAVGSDFDPRQQQAVAALESTQPVNTVVSRLQRGYMIESRVLRPAMVTVSKAAEKIAVDEEE